MGLRGLHSKPVSSNRRAIDDLIITPQALLIYRKMRRHERQQGGPGGDEWWAMNAKLAECFGLFAGMVVYEDPDWESDRPLPSALVRFDVLEAAASKAKKERRYKYKWER
jgi:hypothetical protein